jgi:prepilin-type processing-associated H-X9-DG protein
MTNYVVVVGPETAWPGSEPTKLADFADGSSNTILVVEVKNSGIHWMEPRDLHVVQMAPGVNPKAGQGVSSNHPSGANVARADGSVGFLPEDTSADVLRAMLTIDGGEKVSP